MNTKTLVLVSAVAGLLLGLGYLIVPGILLGFFGADLDQVSEVGMMTTRFFGGAIVGYAVLCWFGRNAAVADIRQYIAPALFTTFLIGFVLALIAQLTNIMGATGWIAVVILAAFALMWGYALFVQKSKS